MTLDEKHLEMEGQLIDISFDEDSQTRADVTFVREVEDGEDIVIENARTWRFPLTQILKFAGLRKSDLKEKYIDADGNEAWRTKDDAAQMVLDGIEEESLTFKYKDERMSGREDKRPELLAVVSNNYVTIPSDKLDDLMNQTLGAMGVTGDDMQRTIKRRGYVVELDYTWPTEQEVEKVGDTLNGGIAIRNSVFGASSLRVNKFFTVLACSNGMLVKDTEKSFRQIHMGDESELEEAFINEVEVQIENLWEETDLIECVGGIEFPLQEQLEFVDTLAKNGKITKKSAGVVMANLIDGLEGDRDDFEELLEDYSVPDAVRGNWNVGRTNAWNLVNAFTGYVTHSDMVSNSSRNKMERVYNDILYAKSKDEVLAVAE